MPNKKKKKKKMKYKKNKHKTKQKQPQNNANYAKGKQPIHAVHLYIELAASYNIYD